MRRIPVIVGAVTLSCTITVGALAALPGSAGAAGSAQSRYEAALVYAGKEDVHFVSHATEDGSVLSVVGNTAPTSGTQSLTITKGSVKENLAVTLLGKTGYLRGNVAALEKVLGMTATQATPNAGKWLYFPVGNQDLDELLSGLSNKDIATELRLNGPYTFSGTKTIEGHATQGIIGSTTGSSGSKIVTTLYVETGSTPRPLQEVSDPGKGKGSVDGTVTFSDWGQKTHITKPAHASSLLALAQTG